jgi:acyl-coenzyme A synthetase/AMP-(fatty) acid ligase
MACMRLLTHYNAQFHTEYSIIYRTGDYARLVKGVLVYEGRTDSQIKVRGYRVDLSEVERALREAPSVDKAVVLCWRPGREEQVSYLSYPRLFCK